MRSSPGIVAAALLSPFVVVAAIASCSTDVTSSSTAAGGGLPTSTTESTGSTTTSTATTMMTSSSSGMRDAATDAPPVDAGSGPCSLPGSVQFTSQGIAVIPGGQADAPDFTFLNLPVGFCAHFFARVGNARQIRFAPGGELFVASPTTITTGGGSGGKNAIIVIPDDDGDGYGDSTNVFLGNLPATQGLAFTTNALLYQDDKHIMKMPYASGDRTPSAAATSIANITYYTSSLHWPKPIDVADDGTIYVGNGGDQGEPCDTSRPVHGAVVRLPSGGGAVVPVAKGLRNPIAIRCTHGAHAQCFGLELAKDYSYGMGGREKMFAIKDGDDWGFPCCAAKNIPYADLTPVPDCSGTTPESAGFLIGDTPFGVAFETGNWPAPWANRAYIVLHGAAGGWTGSRMVSVEMDPATGLPVKGTDLDGGSMGGMVDFATGWDDNTLSHGRPAAVDFSSDGRLFVANDNDGTIFWIAPF